MLFLLLFNNFYYYLMIFIFFNIIFSAPIVHLFNSSIEPLEQIHSGFMTIYDNFDVVKNRSNFFFIAKLFLYSFFS